VLGDDFVAELHIGCTRVYEQSRCRSALYSVQTAGSHIA